MYRVWQVLQAKSEALETETDINLLRVFWVGHWFDVISGYVFMFCFDTRVTSCLFISVL